MSLSSAFRFWLGVLLAAMALLVVSCGGSGKGDRPAGAAGEGEGAGETEKKAPAILVGEVVSVHPMEGETGFVLIRRYAQGRFDPTMIYSASDHTGATASLQPTGERLGRFYAADILEGEPKVGDMVIGRRLPQGAVPDYVPVPEPLGENEPKPWL